VCYRQIRRIKSEYLFGVGNGQPDVPLGIIPIINMASVPSSVREFVNHRFDDDRYIPYNGEIILVRLSKDLTGPGSALTSLSDLPSCSTCRNYHYAMVLASTVPSSGLEFTVFPVPSYSVMDPISHLTSTG